MSPEYRHDADSLGGSSGSPLFSVAQNTVVGLHHLGIGGDSNGRGSHNMAVPMWKIVNLLVLKNYDWGSDDSGSNRNLAHDQQVTKIDLAGRDHPLF